MDNTYVMVDINKVYERKIVHSVNYIDYKLTSNAQKNMGKECIKKA